MTEAEMKEKVARHLASEGHAGLHIHGEPAAEWVARTVFRATGTPSNGYPLSRPELVTLTAAAISAIVSGPTREPANVGWQAAQIAQAALTEIGRIMSERTT